MESEIMAKGYEPGDVEKKWYEYWEENGLFKAKGKSDAKAYCIVIPPPNVTGTLHMGHALNNTLQDILCRYKKMKGFLGYHFGFGSLSLLDFGFKPRKTQDPRKEKEEITEIEEPEDEEASAPTVARPSRTSTERAAP